MLKAGTCTFSRKKGRRNGDVENAEDFTESLNSETQTLFGLVIIFAARDFRQFFTHAMRVTWKNHLQ